jgi:hypothetical protein
MVLARVARKEFFGINTRGNAAIETTSQNRSAVRLRPDDAFYVLEPQRGPANAPVAALHLVKDDPRKFAQLRTNDGSDYFGDSPNHFFRLVRRELAFKDIELYEWHV